MTGKPMSTADYTYLPDLLDTLPAITPETIVSRTVFKNDRLNVILFGFAAGEELSEHTAAFPAALHFLRGEARLTLGETPLRAQAGTWVHMPAHLPHSVYAETEVVMLLTMFR